MTQRYGLYGAALLIGVLGIGPAGAAELLFQAEAQVLNGNCAGMAVRLEGNHNTLTLGGRCTSLLVKGLANTVSLTIAPGGAIRVEGGQNRIRFITSGTSPIIELLGPDNEASAGSPVQPMAIPPALPAPPPTIQASTSPPVAVTQKPPAAAAKSASGALELVGSDQERLADCTGRDVVVAGDRSAYVLRGGCRSLSLRGDLLTVQAVVQPGARIVVTGRGSIVSWAVMGKGRAPAGQVRGAGSRVQKAVAIGGQPVP